MQEKLESALEDANLNNQYNNILKHVIETTKKGIEVHLRNESHEVIELKSQLVCKEHEIQETTKRAAQSEKQAIELKRKVKDDVVHTYIMEDSYTIWK